MIHLPAPSLPDLARASGQTLEEMVEWLKAYYSDQGGFFNYLSGTRSVKQSYRGFHNLPQLIAGTQADRTAQSRKSNAEIVTMAAPLAFGRKTQVFDLPKRQFHFGRDLSTGYRVPFFFVENGIIHLYFLQPRKSFNLTHAELSMVATVHKKYLLDNEFYGESADIEYVDLSEDEETKVRQLNRFKLDDLELWSDKKLADKLTLVAEALDFIKKHELVKLKKRVKRSTADDMPSFF